MDFEEEKVEQEQEELAENLFVSYLRDFTAVMVVVMLLFFLFFRIIIVSGPSMNDTLEHGDMLLLVSRVFYHNPKPGDIVVATKESFRDGEPIIKRIIATEGQVVDIDFLSGSVYVDGKLLEESDYIKGSTINQEGMRFPLVVKENHVFVMGDNREESLDSRSPQIGQIEVRQILGKAVFLILPGQTEEKSRNFKRIGVLN